MKPEKLILCGWGPYKEETTIDFEKVNMSGLFLVTGQTGAGKTTIFDAIAYALYGVLSGETREKGSVRSDFADVDTKTYVELYMRHKNESYHISRNPEYMRPKKKKSGEHAFTKEKENAVLTMPDGTIIAGNQDVTARIEELLHMDGRQFRQISMIAQGEFSKLLFASSTEKNIIFRELFGTGLYAQIQSELKNRSAQLYREYMVFYHKMEEDIRLLTLKEEAWKELAEQESPDLEAIISYLEQRIKQEGKELDTQKKKAVSLEKELLALEKETEAIRQMNARFRELEETKQRIGTLTKQQPKIELLKQQIQIAKKAQVLFWEEKVVFERENAVTEVSKLLQELETELSELCKQGKAQESIIAIKDLLADAFALKEQLQEEEVLLEHKLQEKERIEIEAQNAKNAYEKAQQESIEKSRRYEEADICYKKAVIGIAAKMVKEGEPCPVCGSLTHPQIAHVKEEIPDEKQLEQWKKEAEKSKAEENRCYEQALLLTGEEKRIQEEFSKHIKEKEQLRETWIFLLPEVREYVDSHKKEELEKTIQENIRIKTVIKEKEKILTENRQKEQEKREEAEKERRDFGKKILESGFLDEAQYRQAEEMLTKWEAWEEECRTYEDTLVSAKNLLQHLQESLVGFEPKEESIYQELSLKKQEEIREYRKQMEEKSMVISQMTHSLTGILKNRAQAEKIHKEYGIVKDLDDLANGNNAKRLVFEQFVLAGYFENVLKAANLRLAAMTEGRYELYRAGEVSDGRKKDNLEILVMDYYTGRERSVKTLSGGETFKASLALALGMSDCIQAENGGIEVETLFIDEGFGALDEESLEQACITLQTLAGKNRMIGVISHVTQLQERIEHQIIIEKRNNGSFIRVI